MPDSETKVTCLACRKKAELREIYAGSYLDKAYGAPKLHKVYRLVTACCNSEDYEERGTEGETMNETCGDCIHNWCNEECSISGNVIYEWYNACDNFEKKGKQAGEG